MIKGVLTFGLTRRPIVLLGLLVFICAGLIAFTRVGTTRSPTERTLHIAASLLLNIPKTNENQRK